MYENLLLIIDILLCALYTSRSAESAPQHPLSTLFDPACSKKLLVAALSPNEKLSLQHEARRGIRRRVLRRRRSSAALAPRSYQSFNITCRAVRVRASPAMRTTPSSDGDYDNVGMQCVSEFNWNQGTQSTFALLPPK